MKKPRIKMRNKSKLSGFDYATWTIELPCGEFIVAAVYPDLLASRLYTEDVLTVMYKEWCTYKTNASWSR